MNLTIARIQRETALHYDLDLDKLLCERRLKDWARPRHVAMYLSRRLRNGTRERSFLQIAKLFDRSDHTTVLNACRKVEQRLRTDPETQAHVGAILNRLFA